MLHEKIANFLTQTGYGWIISPLIISLLGCVWLLPTTAFAAQSLESIRTTAKQYLSSHHTEDKGNFEINVGQLDGRLQLADCSVPLQAYLPPGGKTIGNISVGVRCRGEKPWSIFVAARVSKYVDVLVATRSLPRGKHINLHDVTLKRKNITNLYRGYLTKPDEIKGKLLKRTVSPGVILTTAMLKKPDQVKRGEFISILAHNKAIEVRMRGEALSNGAIGDKIRARNLNTRKIVEGTITSDGSLEVRL